MAGSAVFLDRDGVLNEIVERHGLPGSPRSVAELRLLPGVAEACRAFKAAGLALVCATNQPDIARGHLRAEDLSEIHAELARLLPLDSIRACPHDDSDACTCRKPKPGMILEAATALDLDPGSSIMVGDRAKDIDAGRAAGAATVLVRNGYEDERGIDADIVCGSLAAAVPWILARAGS